MRRRSVLWRLFLAACAVVFWVTGCSGCSNRQAANGSNGSTGSTGAAEPATDLDTAPWPIRVDALAGVAVVDGHSVAMPPVARWLADGEAAACVVKGRRGIPLLPVARWPV
jgi:hypothetical protein